MYIDANMSYLIVSSSVVQISEALNITEKPALPSSLPDEEVIGPCVIED
jgi:hypothetical protein